MSSISEVKWLWRSTECESIFENITTSYRLALATSRPLLECDFNLALRYLFRKVPSLRSCWGERDGKRWMREMDHEAIDFQMLPGGKTTGILSLLHHYTFDKTRGPLWCVKVKPGEVDPVAEFKHVYDVFLGINHAITDGISNVKICGLLVQLLDQLIAGTSVDDTQQVGMFISDEKTQALIQENSVALKADPQLHSHLKADHESCLNTRSLLKSTFKALEDKEAESHMIRWDLKGDITSSFIRRCRAEGVTVTSAFTAIANVALVDLLSEGGLLQASYALRSDHVVNARRYWMGDASHTLGCHVLPFVPVVLRTPRNVRDNLWIYAKTVHQELRERFGTLSVESAKNVVWETTNKTFQMEFCLTNMGDVSPTLMETGKEVRVLHLLRSSSIHDTPMNFLILVHTFGGRMNCNMVYNTSQIPSDTAQTFSGLVFDYIHAAIRD